jgi:hypothetical protein
LASERELGVDSSPVRANPGFICEP